MAQQIISPSPLVTLPTSIPTPIFPLESRAEELLRANTPLLHGTNVEKKREEIRKYFHNTASVFEALHDTLINDDIYYYQPERLRHPLVFYFGHTAVFYINKLNIAGHIRKRIDPSVESMCAIGVDEMSWDDLNPSHYNWPSIPRLRAYRKSVRDLVDNLITNSPLSLPITWDSVFWIILMGAEHERIHLETSSVLFRQLPPQFVKQIPLFQRYHSPITPQDVLEKNQLLISHANHQLIEINQHIVSGVDITSEQTHIMTSPLATQHAYNTAANTTTITFDQSLFSLANALKSRTFTTKFVPARKVVLGKDFNHHFYGWDNEFGQEIADVKNFEISTKLVTNQQFLLFVLIGGYYNPQFWSTEEGWNFAQYKTNTLKMPWPTFWYPMASELNNISYPTPTSAILEGTNTIYDLDSDSQSQLPTDFNSTMRVHGLPFAEISTLSITDFKYRWLSGMMDMPWDWPVDINNLEAQAYATWVQSLILPDTPLSDDENGPLEGQKQCRIPTEFEYRSLVLHCMSTYGAIAQGNPITPPHEIFSTVDEYDFPLNRDKIIQNISLTHASSCPVDLYPYFNSGFYDVIGNTWQHCCSVIYPFNHFKVHPAYDDFTVPTYDNMHAIIAGGSWISSGNEACYHARYAFRRHFYQHAGCRIGLFTTKPKTATLQSIEQDVSIANLLHNDFYDLLTNEDLVQCETPHNKQILKQREVNSKQTASLVYNTIEKLKQSGDLDDFYVPHHIMVLGCRGGRLAMELGVLYDNAKVTGIDTTVRLLGAGLRLFEGLQVSYLLQSSYDQTTFVRIRDNAYIEYCQKHFIDLSTLKQRVSLIQTDVVNLPEDKVPFNTYNCIIVDNLDTTYNPRLQLQNLQQQCVNNNQPCLIALCVYHTWDTNSSTANNVWGYRDESTGEFVDVERGVSLIAPSFKLLKKIDYNPRMRRVNERMYSHIDMTCYFYLNLKE